MDMWNHPTIFQSHQQENQGDGRGGREVGHPVMQQYAGENHVEDKIKDKRVLYPAGEVKQHGKYHQVNDNMDVANGSGLLNQWESRLRYQE